MTDGTEFTIGADAVCSDGNCGHVTRVVIDPVAEVITDLVIEPHHRSGLGRLVPLDMIDVAPDEVRVRCDLAAFDRLPRAEETRFLPGNNGGYGGYGPGQAVCLPYFRVRGDMSLGSPIDPGDAFQPAVYDALPLGEVAIQRDEEVHATDGSVGRVKGLVIESRHHHVTHVLLQGGHIWGRREIAVPIGDVARIDDGIRLRISKGQVQDLPAVDVEDLVIS